MYQNDYNDEEKPKNKIISTISGLLATFFDRLLYIIIGIIIGVGVFIAISFLF
jgi:hypothetical protein